MKIAIFLTSRRHRNARLGAISALFYCCASCTGSSVTVENQLAQSDNTVVANETTILSSETASPAEINQTASASPQSPTPRALKVLPIGDSITSGYNSCSYRTSLVRLLRSHLVEFVGSLSHNKLHPGNCANSNMAHEGRAGSRTIDWLQHEENNKSRAFNVTNLEKPDVVLLHIGSNDINRGESPGQFDEYIGSGNGTIGRIDNLLDEIFTASPGVTIFLADIIPWLQDSTVNDGLTQLRSEIYKLLNYRSSVNDRVHVVRVFEEFQPAFLQSDLIHPNADGDSYLATKWIQALQTYGLFLGNDTVSNTRVEVELGELTGNMIVGAQQDTTFVQTTNPTAYRAEHVSINATLMHKGLYRVLGRILRESAASGPLFFQAPPADVQPWYIPASDRFTTDYVGENPRTYLYLEAGTHSFNIFSNRTDTGIDWIEFQFLGDDPNGDVDSDGTSNQTDLFPNDPTK